MAMNINKMTRKQFEALPFRERWEKEVECDGIVILPGRRFHESGFRYMDYVAVKGGEAICRLSGSSDVLHINGIGGFGYNWKSLPLSVPPVGWSIDCLPRSGLLHLFCSRTLIAGEALSSFEIFVGDLTDAV